MKINIKFVKDDFLETLKRNSASVYKVIIENKNNSQWTNNYSRDIYVTKKFQMNDFKLDISPTHNYKSVDLDNSIKLYENLRHLPLYILTDVRFWLWLHLDKFYKVTLQAIPIKGQSTLDNHWLFKQGRRRGVFFGTLSRSFFRVYLSVDESLEDKYELTKYVIENPSRFRNMSWRSYSSQKHIVLGALKAQKDFEEKYDRVLSSKVFEEIAMYIGRLGSVKLLDAFTEEEIYGAVTKKLIKMTGV